jgi:hypothetical protein
MPRVLRSRLVVALLCVAIIGSSGSFFPPAVRSAAGTGYYGVEQRDGRWWLITPNGSPFFSSGVDYVNPSGFADARDGTYPYRAVLETKYGRPVNQRAWAADAGARLRAWGFNTVGAFSAGAGGALAGLPDTPTLFPIAGGVIPAVHKTTGGSDAYPLMNISPNDPWAFHRIFVDVYHPVFSSTVASYFAAQLPARAADPNLIGYYIDNELPFWYRNSTDKRATNAGTPNAHTLADSYIALGADTWGKKAWIELLRRRYGNNIGALNAAWGAAYPSFETLLAVTAVPNDYAAPRADKSAFLDDIATTYFKTMHDSFRTYDRNHLILGCRFVAADDIDTPLEILRAAGRYQDVVSLNYYIWDTETYIQRRARIQARYAKFAHATGRPILNGEFSFAARDAGLSNAWHLGELVETQTERAQRYEDVVRITAGIPEAVGLAWWAYVDELDANQGLVNNADMPYAALTQRMALVNPQLVGLHEKAVPPPSPTVKLTLAPSAGGSLASAAAGYPIPIGGTVVVTAAPAAGHILTGWTIDGVARGWANPLNLSMDTDHTIDATFAPRPGYADVAPGDPAHEAIGQLAARGVIKGYGDGTFGPGDISLRAQMAALIARAVGWDAEDHGNTFTDRSTVDADLWRNVGTLAFYGVAKGYDATTFAPTGQVAHVQTISFIARAMVAKGYWTQQPDDPLIYPNVPASSGHRQDLVTFVHYAGPLPERPAGGVWAEWAAPSTRGWFAQILWQALDSRFGVR